jgi:hypothetical protein
MPPEDIDAACVRALQVLGLCRRSSIPEAKQRYRKLSLMHHPDKCKVAEDVEIATQRQTRLNEAWDLLPTAEMLKEDRSSQYHSPRYCESKRYNSPSCCESERYTSPSGCESEGYSSPSGCESEGYPSPSCGESEVQPFNVPGQVIDDAKGLVGSGQRCGCGAMLPKHKQGCSLHRRGAHNSKKP